MTKFGHKICIGFRMRTTSMINWGGIRRRYDPMYQPDKICFVNPAYKLFSCAHCTPYSVAYQWIKLCKHTRLCRQYRTDTKYRLFCPQRVNSQENSFPFFCQLRQKSSTDRLTIFIMAAFHVFKYGNPRKIDPMLRRILQRRYRFTQNLRRYNP